MHLLSTREVPLDAGADPVDLGQSLGDIILLSAADSEIACLAQGRRALGPTFPSVRLASLMRLQHPLSIDLHVERVVARARLVVLRVLGGRGYWGYGLEQVAETCRRNGIPLAALPGDDRPDAELAGWSTLGAEACRRLWRYLGEGGIANGEQCLRYAASLIGHDVPWLEPAPLLRAGLYKPGRGILAPDDLRSDGRPLALVVLYRALIQAGDLLPIDSLLAELEARGFMAVGLFATSLKEPDAGVLIERLIALRPPSIILNATGFTLGAEADPLRLPGVPILQVVLASGELEAWRDGTAGLGPRDLAMSVALPEIDGRVLARAVSFKSMGERCPLTEVDLVRHRPVADRIAFSADLAAAWSRLQVTPAADRRIAIVLPNYPARDGRLANGVGLDTPASAVGVLRAMRGAGYSVAGIPADADALMGELSRGVTNELAGRNERTQRVTLPLARYRELLETLPAELRRAVEERWGQPEEDPHVRNECFVLAILPLGNVVIGLQPARGYHVDPKRTYHAPDLVPPHGYLAFHLWLRHELKLHAIVHLGKHGNLEWLPGKALALSSRCWPEAALGPLPHLYPFIVNDPGEGTQAKRRTSAVIIDHLTPPLTRAESYGPLRELEQLLDEYAMAQRLDPRRLDHLAREILDRSSSLGLDADLGIPADTALGERLAALDAHLCDIKELQIRDGLHILGTSPTGDQQTDLLVALVRVPRGSDGGGAASLQRALAQDLGLQGFDPLDTDPSAGWSGPMPAPLSNACSDPWRTAGDTIERLEILSHLLVAGKRRPDPAWERTAAVLGEVEGHLRPAITASGPAEVDGLLRGLDGRFVEPGPSGAPTRGRPDVLPTGRNFHSVDTRAVPTPAAWHLGWRSADLVVERYLQLHGTWPRQVALSAWGTSCMRTGGDDLAQALALLGCRPVWDTHSHRVTGIEVLPLDVLARPRVDVTFRVSGFFRDAFPTQIELLDDAIRAVARLDEPAEMNPLAASARDEAAQLRNEGLDEAGAERRATARIFGSMPGAYGAGLQAMIDAGGWEDEADLAAAYRSWGGFTYGRGLAGLADAEALERRLSSIQLVLHNQDNREHDLLDSDDYYQFEGGLAAAVRVASGRQPEIFHNDHARPESPRVRTLRHEIGRVVRGRAANPKWIAGVMRHGYKGAFEIAATVDYLFAFAATTRAVDDHHFDALFDAYLVDETVRDFIALHNPAALREIVACFGEAIRRELWRPRRNSAAELLTGLGA